MSERTVMQRGISSVRDVSTRPGGVPHIRVGQVLEPGLWEENDPFLFLAEDWFQQGTFDFHPHRGIETVTFIIEGKLKHEDNYGGYGVLEPGDVQWMTAGRGIIHSEDPLPGETVHSLQLWVNLPRAHKLADPSYKDLKAADVPVRKEGGALVRVFSGSSGDVLVPTARYAPVTYVELVLEAGAAISQDLPGSYNGFVYVLDGAGYFGAGETRGEKNQVLRLGPADGANLSEVRVRADADQPLRALLIAGEPVREPVVQYGPFVMNTEDEIRQAFEDYRSGKFGPIPKR